MSTLGSSISRNLITPQSCWQLNASINGYAELSGNQLATQVVAGRRFQVINHSKKFDISGVSSNRLKVLLFEDGYKCWLKEEDVRANQILSSSWKPKLLESNQIETKLPAVLAWIQNAYKKDNQYLWGGTLGPDFDCSGLVQAAFASQEIWLPRDACQQEEFAHPIDASPGGYELLIPGDLIFFGSSEKCTHVSIYKGNGFYWHSSGVQNGRNGIGLDGLQLGDQNPIASYYRDQFRGAGRVLRCYQGANLLQAGL